MPIQSRSLWDEMCDVIKWHNYAQHCCVDTVNRLWRKDPFVLSPSALPVISRELLDVSLENWSLDQLLRFIGPERETDLQPAATDCALVVLRWQEVDYLIDGRRRINHWKRQQLCGPHRVLILHARCVVTKHGDRNAA
jgi:hypothetical protein